MSQATAHMPLMKFPEDYPEQLEHMGQIIGRELVRHGLDHQSANSKAFEILEVIRDEMGGATPFYVPKGLKYELSIREQQMWDDFKGNNYDELGRKYDLCEMQVRNVINKARIKMQERSGQLRLLDD
jgi:Mor family transcriptional regulator